MPRLIEYKDMNPRAKAVVEDIAQRRNIDPAGINNVWKALAGTRRDGALCRGDEGAFAPGALDPLTKN